MIDYAKQGCHWWGVGWSRSNDNFGQTGHSLLIYVPYVSRIVSVMLRYIGSSIILCYLTSMNDP